MMLARQGPASDGRPEVHVATIAHAGQIWDAYLAFEDDPRKPDSCRGRFRFDLANSDGAIRSARTTVIIIEASYEEAVAKARSFDDRQLEGLLRSSLPDDEAS